LGAVSTGAVLPSGHALLDAELPGGGWPGQALTEILQTQAGLAEWRLLLPALRQLVQRGGHVLLIGAPLQPQVTALWREGLPPERLVCVGANTVAERLWATEQALKAGCLSAVLVWLPQVRPQALRRLQACAARHAGPVFVFRPPQAALEPSPAPLRLHLGVGGCPHPMRVRLFKRRGPAHAEAIVLPHWPVGLAALLPQPALSVMPALPTRHAPATPLDLEFESHVALDRPVARASA
jgi:protein ImuA